MSDPNLVNPPAPAAPAAPPAGPVNLTDSDGENSNQPGLFSGDTGDARTRPLIHGGR